MATSENITILFTDLVGSTELAAALSVDAGEHIRREHFSALRKAVATTGGTVVKTMGDGFMVVFASASAALECAVAMQHAVERSSAATNRPLLMRVGVSAGEVIRDTDDYYGEPVVEAARLCGRAEGGQILVADVVRALAGRRYPRTFISLGPLELGRMVQRLARHLSWCIYLSPFCPGEIDLTLEPNSLDSTNPLLELGAVGCQGGRRPTVAHRGLISLQKPSDVVAGCNGDYASPRGHARPSKGWRRC